MKKRTVLVEPFWKNNDYDNLARKQADQLAREVFEETEKAGYLPARIRTKLANKLDAIIQTRMFKYRSLIRLCEGIGITLHAQPMTPSQIEQWALARQGIMENARRK